MRVLFFGYSVTEQRVSSFVAATERLLRSKFDELSVEVCGLGGMDLLTALYLFDAAVPRGKYDVVVFDLNTSSYRMKIAHQYGSDDIAAADSFGLPILQIISKAMRRGARPILLNLPVVSIDPNADQMNKICQKICDRLSIRYIDIAATRMAEDLSRILMDHVHTNDWGAELYSSIVFPAIIEEISRSQPAAGADLLQLAEATRAIKISDCAPHLDTINNSRSFPVEGVALYGGATISVSLGTELEIAGVTYIMGPTSGYFSISSPKWEDDVCVSAYDEWSFYDRLNGCVFEKPRTARELIFCQSTGVPEIELLKGDKNHGPRVGAAAHLFVNQQSLLPQLEKFRQLWT